LISQEKETHFCQNPIVTKLAGTFFSLKKNGAGCIPLPALENTLDVTRAAYKGAEGAMPLYFFIGT